MQRLMDWVGKHKWAYPFVLPIAIPYIIWKIPGALKEWGES